MKVAIVCGAPSSEFLAPYGDKDVEIWVLGNRLERHIDKRVTRVFEIHDNLTEHDDPAKYAQWLVSHNLPLIVGEKFLEGGAIRGDGSRQVTVYPYAAVETLYGSVYLTSSPAYMIAYALLLGANEIQVYGVDLSISDHEYFWQRPCVEAWIGFAKGLGVKIVIPEVSHVGKSKYVEGRDWNNDTEIGVFSEENFGAMSGQHKSAMDALQKQRQELALKVAAHDGAMQVYQNLAKVARAVEAQVDVKSLSETTLLR